MDFFQNIIKTTVTKVENFSKPSNIETNEEQNNDESVDNDKESKQSVVNDAKAEQQMHRSSSGETSGPDDEQGDVIAEDNSEDKDKANANLTSDVSQKALESAKYFGNFIYSVANRAGQRVTATAKQLKQSVEQTGIMQEFTKEQQEFIKEHGGNTDLAELPWVGCEDEEKVKTEILSLSQDKRNFVRSPPSGVQFAFDMDSSYPIALALLKEDPNLNKMRFEIVPKLVKEETFWRNYFYRVSLIKQSTQFSAFDKKGANTSWSSSRSSSAEGPDDPNDDQSPTGAEPEFVSDAYQSSKVSAEEVRKGMRQLGVRKDSNKATDDLEEELSKDLQEFEVVAGDAVHIDEEELERELAEMDIK